MLAMGGDVRVATGTWLLVAAGLMAGAGQAHAALMIEQSVDAEVLTADAVVEFVVTVRNTGEEVIDSGEVSVVFSPGLEVPAGTAPFYSQGSFDPVEGRWTMGEIRPGASAVLSMPAQVSADPLPPCVFSRARLESSQGDPSWAGDLSFAAIRLPGVEHCVDLEIDSLSIYRSGWCSSELTVELRVWNRGPDPAHQVRVSVLQQPAVLPGLAFYSPLFVHSPCSGGLECVLDTLGPGQPARMWLRSPEFENRNTAVVTVEVTADSTGTEFETGQEVLRRTLTITPYEVCEPIKIDLGPPSGSGCFIATAAYGSALHPRVVILRRFRDRFMLTHAPGRALVAAYYRASPPIASYIAERPVARAMVRALLWPLVLAVDHPLPVLGAMTLGLALLRGRRRDRLPGPVPGSTQDSTAKMPVIPRMIAMKTIRAITDRLRDVSHRAIGVGLQACRGRTVPGRRRHLSLLGRDP